MFGFTAIQAWFDQLLAEQNLSHAYLFTGQAMIGKCTFALALAERLGGPDKLILQTGAGAVKTIGIAEVRQLKNFLALTPWPGRQRVAVIDEAERLTEEAQNALLKILEEPSPAALLILVTAHPGALLSTILSRCQTIIFPTPSPAIIQQVLAKSDFTTAQKTWLASFVNGRVGLLQRLMANQALPSIKTTLTELADLSQANLVQRFAFAEKMSDDENSVALREKVFYWLLYARTQLTKPRFVRLTQGLLELNRVIGQSQYNTRLALENFLINI